MKKNIINYILIVFSGALMFSCDDFDPEIHYYDSVKINLKSNEISVLDSYMNLKIDFVSTTKLVSDVIVFADDKEISKGVAVDNKYSFDLSRDVFAPNAKIGDKKKVYINAIVDGVEKLMYTHIILVSASSIDAPKEVFELSNIEKLFVYGIETASIVDVSIKAEFKVGVKGEYTQLWSKKYDKTDLTIPFKGVDYNLADTVYLKLTSSISDYSESIENYFVVMPYVSAKPGAAVVSYKNEFYNLLENKKAESNNYSFKFISNTDNHTIGFECNNGLELIIVDEIETNIPLIKKAFDSSISISKLKQATTGDKFLLKQSVNGKTYYGSMEITNLIRTTIKEDGLIDFNFVLEEFSLNK